MVAMMAVPIFADREAAGARLGEALASAGTAADLVLGIPRGGVVVGAPVARALGVPLDVLVARKVGAPGRPELALGAVGPDGALVIDPDVADATLPSRRWLDAAVAAAREEVDERLALYRAGRPPLQVSGLRVVVVDDGIATGSTAIAAGRWLGAAGAAHRLLAVPAGPPRTDLRVGDAYDDVAVLVEPDNFVAVGQVYRDFSQTTDEEVLRALGSS
jgi:predicted phosphoribosyltransferase